jgi:hypothetical protein
LPHFNQHLLCTDADFGQAHLSLQYACYYKA